MFFSFVTSLIYMPLCLAHCEHMVGVSEMKMRVCQLCAAHRSQELRAPHALRPRLAAQDLWKAAGTSCLVISSLEQPWAAHMLPLSLCVGTGKRLEIPAGCKLTLKHLKVWGTL